MAHDSSLFNQRFNTKKTKADVGFVGTPMELNGSHTPTPANLPRVSLVAVTTPQDRYKKYFCYNWQPTWQPKIPNFLGDWCSHWCGGESQRPFRFSTMPSQQSKKGSKSWLLWETSSFPSGHWRKILLFGSQAEDRNPNWAAAKTPRWTALLAMHYSMDIHCR